MSTLHTFTEEEYERYCAQCFMMNLLIGRFEKSPDLGASYEELYAEGNRYWNGPKEFDPFKHRRKVRDGLRDAQMKLDESFSSSGVRYVIERVDTHGFRIVEKPEWPKVPPPPRVR